MAPRLTTRPSCLALPAEAAASPSLDVSQDGAIPAAGGSPEEKHAEVSPCSTPQERQEAQESVSPVAGAAPEGDEPLPDVCPETHGQTPEGQRATGAAGKATPPRGALHGGGATVKSASVAAKRSAVDGAVEAMLRTLAEARGGTSAPDALVDLMLGLAKQQARSPEASVTTSTSGPS